MKKYKLFLSIGLLACYASAGDDPEMTMDEPEYSDYKEDPWESDVYEDYDDAIAVSKRLLSRFAAAHWEICNTLKEAASDESQASFEKFLKPLTVYAKEADPHNHEEVTEQMEKILKIGKLCHANAVLRGKKPNDVDVITMPDASDQAGDIAAASATTKKRSVRDRFRKIRGDVSSLSSRVKKKRAESRQKRKDRREARRSRQYE